MVGKSDFNENPVVSLDLDLDFGLRLRVCQFLELRCLIIEIVNLTRAAMFKGLLKWKISRKIVYTNLLN